MGATHGYKITNPSFGGILLVYSENIDQRDEKRLKEALKDYGESQTGLKYYILPENEFYEFTFKKESKGGIQGFRYMDLRDYFSESELNSENNNSKTISELLANRIWL